MHAKYQFIIFYPILGLLVNSFKRLQSLVISNNFFRYYNSDFSTFAPEYKDFLKNYFLSQIDGYEYGFTGAGWFFWTAKTENNCAPEWDYLFLLANGIVPQDLCTRNKYCQF